MDVRYVRGESADAFAARCEQIAALGIEHVVVITSGPWSEDAGATLAGVSSAGASGPAA